MSLFTFVTLTERISSVIGEEGLALAKFFSASIWLVGVSPDYVQFIPL